MLQWVNDAPVSTVLIFTFGRWLRDYAWCQDMSLPAVSQAASSVQFAASVVKSLVLSESCQHTARYLPPLRLALCCCGNILLLNSDRFTFQQRFPPDNRDSPLTMTRRWSSEFPGGSGWVCWSEICSRVAFCITTMCYFLRSAAKAKAAMLAQRWVFRCLSLPLGLADEQHVLLKRCFVYERVRLRSKRSMDDTWAK